MKGGIELGIYRSFLQMLKQIKSDMMLLMACFAPILCGVIIKFGIPFGEKLMTDYFDVENIVAPYYIIMDLMLSFLTPLMFCFVCAMVILEEADDKIAEYFAITPLGKSGYLVSRLAIPAAISIAVSSILLSLFTLTQLSTTNIIILSLFGAVQGIMISLLIVSFSSNKLEGMALSKLSGLIIFGIFVPFFITGPQQYLLCFLPSFWISKMIEQNNILISVLAFTTAIIWLFVFSKRFYKRISS